MAKDAIVSEKLAQKFAAEKETPYTRWVAAEGLERISAFYIRNLNTVELKPWPRRGGRAVFINHDASRTSNDCYVCEIPAGGKLAPQRQLYEEMILVLAGRGSTSVWNDKGAKVSFEWGPGAIFGIPLNTHHQHFNFFIIVKVGFLQGFGPGAGALRGGDQPAALDERLREPGVHLQHAVRLRRPVQRRAGIFRQQGRAEGAAA